MTMRYENISTHLGQLGIPYSDISASLHQSLWKLCDEDVESAFDIIHQLQVLNCHYTLTTHATYHAALNISRCYLQIKTMLEVFQFYNYFYQEEQKKYFNLLLMYAHKQPDNSDIARLLFSTEDIGPLTQQNETIYKLCLSLTKKSNLVGHLDSIFNLLVLSNISYKENSRLYYGAIKNREHAMHFAKLFHALKAVGCSYSPETKELYCLVIEYIKYADALCEILYLLRQLGYQYEQNRTILHNIFKHGLSIALDYVQESDTSFNYQNAIGTQLTYLSGSLRFLIFKDYHYSPETASVIQLLTLKPGVRIAYIYRDLQTIAPDIRTDNTLYCNAVANANHSSEFAETLEILSLYAGPYDDKDALVQTIYQDTIRAVRNAPELRSILTGLIDLHFEFSKETNSFYKIVLNHADEFDEKIQLIEQLKKNELKFTEQTTPIISQLFFLETRTVIKCLIGLTNIGYLYTPSNHEIYQTLCNQIEEKDDNAEEWFDEIAGLLEIYQDCRDKDSDLLLLKLILHHGQDVIFYGFDLRDETHINFLLSILPAQFKDHPEHFFLPSALTKQMKQKVESILADTQLTLSHHTLIAHFFGIRITQTLNTYMLKQLILACLSERQITFGPLQKTPSTYMFERVLRYIANHPKDFQFSKNAFNEVCLDCQRDAELGLVNLSLLIQEADLSQLKYHRDKLKKKTRDEEQDKYIDLDEDGTSELVEKLGELLNDLLNKYNIEAIITEGEGPLRELPESLKKAIYLYTGDYYIYPNALFRNEPLEFDDSDIEAINDRDKPYFALLLGVLVCYGINAFSFLLHEPDVLVEEKALLQTLRTANLIPPELKSNLDYQRMINSAYDQQIITKDDHQQLINKYQIIAALLLESNIQLYRSEKAITSSILKKRICKVRTLPALTSTSLEKSVIEDTAFCDNEDKENNLTTVFFDCRFFPINYAGSKYPEEKEVVLSPGTQVLTDFNGSICSSKVISTPTYQHDNYWPEQALRFCFSQHLSKDYAFEPGEDDIPRPNYGLAHIARKMLYLPFVIDYFTMHAKDESFKAFCQLIRKTDVERFLTIAIIFLASGRESEDSFIDNPVRYRQYREASLKNLHEFCTRFKLIFRDCKPVKHKDSEELYYAYLNIHQFDEPFINIGNHDYPKQMQADYKSHKNEASLYHFYVYHILNLAHTLDLPRCYDADSFKMAIQYLEDVVSDDLTQHEDLKALIGYSINLIYTHGDCLYFTFNDAGEYEDCDIDSRHYKSPFIQCSLNVKDCLEATEEVSPPFLSTSYTNLRCF